MLNHKHIKVIKLPLLSSPSILGFVNMCWLLVALLLFSADSFRLTALFYAPSCKTSSKSRHLFAAPILFAAPPFQSQFEKALSIPVASVTTDRIINVNPSLIDKKAIAERLQINSIIDLSGTIKLSNANKKGKELKRRRDDTSAGNNIRVVGDVLATITQRCVRTGELFDEAIVITFNNVVVGDGTSSATSTTDDGIPSMPINRKTNGNSKKTAKALLKRGVEGFNEGFDINNNSMVSEQSELALRKSSM